MPNIRSTFKKKLSISNLLLKKGRTVLKTKNNNLNQGAKAPPQQSTYQNSNNATLGKVTNKNAVNCKQEDFTISIFLDCSLYFRILFSLIVFSDDPERFN